MDQTENKESMSEINWALGLFLLCFGLIVGFAVFFTETTAGKITNVVAGFIFAAIGLVMMFKRKAKSGDQ